MLAAWIVQWLAAEPAGPAGTPAWDTFAQYSVLGVAVLVLGWIVFRILAQLWTRSAEELAREVARADRQETENRALNLVMQDKVIPALLAAATAMTECTELLRDQQQRERERDFTHRRRDAEGR